MKKIFKYLFIGLFGVLSMSSCSSDLLETEPTDSMSGSTFMSDASMALVPLNGIYRSMYTAGWSTSGNTHQCFGISAYNLMAEVMGDDLIMGAMGSGWFWYDAIYNVKRLYTRSSWRSYDLWFAYYTWIANANYIIAGEETMGGNTADVNYAIGQAYAIRGYSYFMLAQIFARTYKGHESEACVPLYDSPTYTSTTGQPRATVQEVYNQIVSDLNKAIELMSVDKGRQDHPSHMGYCVAQGIRARVAMVMNDWNAAIVAAQEVLSFSGKSILPVASFTGCNDAYADNVLWGAEIVSDQAGMYASLYAHMSTDVAYGARAPKQITRWLYDKISDTDARKAWWNTESSYNFATNNEVSGYVQQKMYFSNLSTWEGDYVWMRVEEMYLTIAEAYCHLGDDAHAMTYLKDLMAQRDPNYTCTKSGNALATMTNEETGSLLEEILLQRRIELWGEDGRIYTIKRLRQGFERLAEDGWPVNLQSASLGNRYLDNPESYAWVLTIPQAEFDGNENLDPNKDQNPIPNNP